MKNIEAAIHLEFIRLHIDLVDVLVLTDRFSMKLMDAKAVVKGSLKLINYVKVKNDSKNIEDLLDKIPENSKVFFLTESRFAHRFLLIPVVSNDGKGENDLF